MSTPTDEPPPPSRRHVLKGAIATAGVATVAGLWFDGFGDPSRRRRITPTPADARKGSLNAREFDTLEAALDRLLPSAGASSPGARDVNAIGYFDALMSSDEITASSKDLIRWGAQVLDRRGRNKFSVEFFNKLTPDRQDAVIQGMENSPTGLRWLRLMLEFCLEAFFGDPVHGGNTDAIGWKWAEHQAATPRPTTPGWKPTPLPDPVPRGNK